MTGAAWKISVVVALIYAFGAGVIVGASPVLHSRPAYQPIELSDAERELPVLRQQTVPMSIDLEFVSAADFAKMRGSPDVLAFSLPYASPCQIVFPAGSIIWAYPADPYDGDAGWADQTGDRLAHEILHCIRGAWHPMAH